MNSSFRLTLTIIGFVGICLFFQIVFFITYDYEHNNDKNFKKNKIRETTIDSTLTMEKRIEIYEKKYKNRK